MLGRDQLALALEVLAGAPGLDNAACAKKWADAVGNYLEDVTPPSATIADAKDLLTQQLTAAFELGEPGSVQAIEDALRVYATTAASGMLGGVAPPGPVGLVLMFATPHPETHAAAASRVADAIHAWAITGSVTIPATLPWS